MRLLLDTNVLIALISEKTDLLDRAMREAIAAPDAELHASVASFWEIAIKSRLGKLVVGVPLATLPGLIEQMRMSLIVIDHRHVLTAPEPEPATRDPFDRLLLAQCSVENLRLVTIDRALGSHSLTWRAG
jgi:PIN domain nuclease of toxin-antitoxin system